MERPVAKVLRAAISESDADKAVAADQNFRQFPSGRRRRRTARGRGLAHDDVLEATTYFVPGQGHLLVIIDHIGAIPRSAVA